VRPSAARRGHDPWGGALEVEGDVPSGVPDHVVRAVTENATTLKFTSQGFEED
jgi:hypothetical protein